MPKRPFHLHNGKKGAALGVRVIPRAKKNEIVEVLDDGTLRVRLNTPADSEEINQVLAEFLAQVLGVPISKIDVVAGQSSRDKLVSVLEMDAPAAHQRIMDAIS
jgi:hypothetical protein